MVGGGIAGLAAAHRLVELSRERGRSLQLTLLEARERLGGTIATERADGFLIEAGPDSFISEKPWALALSERIGLGGRLLRTDDRFRRTYVVHAGRLEPLPEGFQLLAPARLGPFLSSRLFSWRGKLRMTMDLVVPRRMGSDDESLGSFVRRRLGAEALDRVAQPLVAGIYTADPDSLSLAATMPRFVEMERTHRSLILALWRASRRVPGVSGARWSLFVTFADGMEELVRALANRLPPGSVRLKERVVGLHRDGGRWRVGLADGSALDADAVIVATEAHQASRLVRSLDPSLAYLLEAIPYASSATVTLAYRQEEIAHPLDGFGFVVPRLERRPILACTFSSVKYPGRAPAGHALLRVFVGGALDEGILKEDDDRIVAIVRAQVGELLGISRPPLLSRVARHPGSMAQYQVGHLETVAAIERRVAAHAGFALAGSAYRGVGISDCIYSGETAASTALAALDLAALS
ncbi:MAG: protoporphyrinogen oxidase [Candidatus Rokubacteria bacterium]|nr:protoporphyrinogen oxidase [Candidatus Rokubacteria bacterium]